MSEKKLDNGLKIVFAPGTFDSFEGTQEELDSLVKEIENALSDNSFLDSLIPLELDEELTSEELLESNFCYKPKRILH